MDGSWNMSRVLGPLALIALALLLRSACHDRFSIEGTVRDTEGQPIAAAVVTVRYQRKIWEETKTARTDEEGAFRISFSPPPGPMPLPVNVQAAGVKGVYLGVPRNQQYRLEAVLAPADSDVKSSHTLEAI